MALSNILREFLVRIRYDVDKGSEKSFTDGLTKATELVGGLGAAIEVTAGAVLYGLTRMSEGIERFYFISQRTGASVAGMKAMGFAAEQMGIGADAAYNAIERLAGFLRSSPQAGNVLKQFGVDVSQDPSKTLENLGRAFARLPLYTAKALAGVVGIDENTMLVMRQGMAEYEEIYDNILRRVGVNENKAAEAGHKFMVQIRTTTAIVKVLTDRVVELLAGKGADAIEKFSNAVLKHFDQITNALSTGAEWVLRMAEVVGRLAVRAVEMASDFTKAFWSLPPVVQHVMEAIGAIMLAFSWFDWPVLAVGALASALLLLYDDYKTWKEGGKHAIDWDTWMPELKKAWDGIMDLANAFWQMSQSVADGYRQLGLFGDKMSDGKLFNKDQIIKDLQDIIGAVGDLARGLAGIIRLYDAMAHGDLKGMANAARQVLLSMGIKPHDDGYGLPGDAGDDRNFWQRIAPKWLGGRDKPTNPTDKAAWDFWKAQGFTDAGAGAMAANEQAESGGDPNAVGDSGNARGLYQWHKDRRDKILSATGIDVWTASADDQRKAMLLEMRQGIDKQSGIVYDAIKNNQIARAAAGLAVYNIERPLDKEGESAVRGDLANSYVKSYGGGDTNKNVKIDSNQTIHVHGATDPQATAAAVGSAASNHNQRLVRNVATAVQ
jgi:hypothetical protein